MPKPKANGSDDRAKQKVWWIDDQISDAVHLFYFFFLYRQSIP